MPSDLTKAKAGRKGAFIRNKFYGNPGTAEGRRKGGMNSLKTHNRLKTGFILRKTFTEPSPSGRLAELFGILIGDGGLSRNQVRVTLNSKETEYATHVVRLVEEMFRYKTSVNHYHPSTTDIYISSRSAIDYLNKLGLPIGDKVRQQHRIPDWIRNKNDFLKACLRGIFDTDGCVFLDKHIYQGTHYASVGLAYTTYSSPLKMDIESGLRYFGFSPVVGTKNRIMIRRRKEALSFFDIIKPANSRHYNRYLMFKEECRELATGRSRKALS